MSPDAIVELALRARSAAFVADHASVLVEVERALETVTDPTGRGHLLLGRALARQGAVDTRRVLADATEALELFRVGEHRPEAALAAAVVAGLAQRVGDVDRVVDHTVEAMVLLAETDSSARDAVRASNALAVIYSEMSAFELAAEASRRAAEGAPMVDTATRAVVSVTASHIVIEGRHLGIDLDAAPAHEAARWLCEEATEPVARALHGPAIRFELANLDPPPDPDWAAWQLPADASDGAAPRFVAWYRLVSAMLARRQGRLEDALVDLERSVPVLLELADDHRAHRALLQRAAVRAELGDLAGAYADATARADLVRQWQVEQVSGLAGQIARRAELEIARTALRRRADDLAREVSVDALTGVGSRRWLELRLDELSDLAGDGAIAVFDLDRFKRVNDGFGHHMGDLVLRRVGRLLDDGARAGDVVARYGGEEFVIVLPGAGLSAAHVVVERLRRRIADESWNELDTRLTVTSSVGLASGRLADARDLLRRADEALYRAKRTGRDRTVTA